MNLKKIIRVAIPVVLVSGIVFCGWQVANKLRDYNISDTYYEKAQESAILQENEEIEPVDDIPVVEGAMQIDWESQKGLNAVAWVQLDNISYPVYHDDGSQWYLKHLPDGTYASAGSIFLYGENSADFTDQSSFIYGHNMGNKTMFGGLKDYAYDEYKDHQFYLYLPDGTRHTYKFFAVASVYQSSQAYTWSFADEESFLNWQQWMKDNAIVQGTAPIDASKRFVTLSTCNGTVGTTRRLVICGQEVAVERTQNPASWYDELKAKIDAQKQASTEVAYQRQADLSEIYTTTQDALMKSRRNQEGE
jgi:sortase B